MGAPIARVAGRLWVALLVPFAVACGSGSGDAGPAEAGDAEVGDGAASRDGTTGRDGTAGRDGATGDHEAQDSALKDAGTEDAAASDGSTDASGPDGMSGGGDARADAACTPVSTVTGACGPSPCTFGTHYCVAGAVPNTCPVTPSACACKETFDCACLLAHTKDPFDGGSLFCTGYFDGGEPWVFVVAP